MEQVYNQVTLSMILLKSFGGLLLIAGTFYLFKIWYPLMLTGYFFGSVLDSVIVFERLNLVKKNKYTCLNAHTPNTVSACIYAACFVFNFTMFFDFSIVSLDFLVDSQPYAIYVPYANPIYSSYVGNIITLIQVILRDFCALILEVVINVWAYLATRTFTKKKKTLLC